MIKVYTKTTCPECVKAKNILNMYGFNYTEINIEEDSNAKTFLLNEGHRSVPQIYVCGELLGGPSAINKERIQELLEVKDEFRE